MSSRHAHPYGMTRKPPRLFLPGILLMMLFFLLLSKAFVFPLFGFMFLAFIGWMKFAAYSGRGDGLHSAWMHAPWNCESRHDGNEAKRKNDDDVIVVEKRKNEPSMGYEAEVFETFDGERLRVIREDDTHNGKAGDEDAIRYV